MVPLLEMVQNISYKNIQGRFEIISLQYIIKITKYTIFLWIVQMSWKVQQHA
jgi:hypothetical protein